jgi:hypothetical protein
METLVSIAEPYADKILLIPALAERWSCGTGPVMQRLKQHGVSVLKFNGRAHGVRLSDVLRLEEEVSE